MIFFIIFSRRFVLNYWNTTTDFEAFKLVYLPKLILIPSWSLLGNFLLATKLRRMRKSNVENKSKVFRSKSTIFTIFNLNYTINRRVRCSIICNVKWNQLVQLLFVNLWKKKKTSMNYSRWFNRNWNSFFYRLLSIP